MFRQHPFCSLFPVIFEDRLEILLQLSNINVMLSSLKDEDNLSVFVALT